MPTDPSSSMPTPDASLLIAVAALLLALNALVEWAVSAARSPAEWVLVLTVGLLLLPRRMQGHE